MLGEFHIVMSEMYYILNDDILHWMVFRFHVLRGRNRTQKATYIVDESKFLPSANCMKDKYMLMTRYQGVLKTKDDNTRLDDITYDLEYMANAIPRVDVVSFLYYFPARLLLCRLTD